MNNDKKDSGQSVSLVERWDSVLALGDPKVAEGIAAARVETEQRIASASKPAERFTV